MFVPGNRSWFRLLLTIRGSALPRIWLRLLITTLVAVVVTVLHEKYKLIHASLTPLPFSLIGLALGIFLGFRNNASYDRFWEGRKLWGGLVNVSRSFARQSLTVLLAPNDDEKRQLRETQIRLIYFTIAYIHALRMHLRDAIDLEQLAAFLPKETRKQLEIHKNIPIAILQIIGLDLQQVVARKWVNAFHLPILEASLTEMAALQGGCERIKATPIPFTYTTLIHRIVAFYCISLPFGLMEQVHHLTPIVVCMVAYAFYGLDSIGDEIEEPFGNDPNDLPLDAITNMIEINLRQSLGETTLPPKNTPVDHILS
jgi:ion channel-forming bestrophin family protein